MSDSTACTAPCIALIRARQDLHRLRRALSAQGIDSLGLPGFELVDSADSVVQAGLDAAMAADVLIVISPHAARRALVRAPRLFTRAAGQVFAVGSGTAGVLTRAGIEVQAPAPVPWGQSASTALLELPALAQVRGSRVCVLGAPEGRDRLQNALRERGALVSELHLYQRMEPKLGTRRIARLASCMPRLRVMASSAAGLAGVRKVLPPDLWSAMRERPLIVSSNELAEISREHGFKFVEVAASALLDDMLAALVQRRIVTPGTG